MTSSRCQESTNLEVLVEAARESHLCAKNNNKIAAHLEKSTWLFHNTTGKIFSGQVKQKLSYMEKKVNQLLNPGVYVQFPPCSLNFYMYNENMET